jgi:hypothetical protein
VTADERVAPVIRIGDYQDPLIGKLDHPKGGNGAEIVDPAAQVAPSHVILLDAPA